MALKKNINADVYLYGVISRIEYSKFRALGVSFTIYKKNSAGDILDIDTTNYFLPDVFPERFSPEALSPEGMNPYRAVYEWLKETKPLFADWEDC